MANFILENGDYEVAVYDPRDGPPMLPEDEEEEVAEDEEQVNEETSGEIWWDETLSE